MHTQGHSHIVSYGDGSPAAYIHPHVDADARPHVHADHDLYPTDHDTDCHSDAYAYPDAHANTDSAAAGDERAGGRSGIVGPANARSIGRSARL